MESTTQKCSEVEVLMSRQLFLSKTQQEELQREQREKRKETLNGRLVKGLKTCSECVCMKLVDAETWLKREVDELVEELKCRARDLQHAFTDCVMSQVNEEQYNHTDLHVGEKMVATWQKKENAAAELRSCFRATESLLEAYCEVTTLELQKAMLRQEFVWGKADCDGGRHNENEEQIPFSNRLRDNIIQLMEARSRLDREMTMLLLKEIKLEPEWQRDETRRTDSSAGPMALAADDDDYSNISSIKNSSSIRGSSSSSSSCSCSSSISRTVDSHQNFIGRLGKYCTLTLRHLISLTSPESPI